MMTKQRFALLAALLAALLLCVPLLFGATAASDAPSEAPVSRGESFSMGEYVLDRDDDYFHFSSDAGVRISGYIGGDLIGFSNEPKISAVIDGNLRFAGVSLEVTGDVARNITVACGEATLAASSKNVYFIGETLYFSGSTGDLTVEAVEVSLSGRVEGDVDVQADRVTFLNGFSCGGTIRVTAKEVDFGPVEAAAVDWNEVTTGSEIGGRLLDLVYNIPAQILSVLLLLFLFRRPFGNLCAGFNRDKVKIVFTGLAGLFIPILAIFLLLTVIGMPVSLLLLAGYLFLYFVCEPVAAILIAGTYINMENKYLSSALVMVAITLLKLVPVLSEAVTLVCFVLVLGTLLRAAFRRGPSVPPPELGGFQV